MSRAYSPGGLHALDQHYVDLLDYLQVDEFVVVYRTTGALQDDDIEKLTSKSTTNGDKIRLLVATVKRRDRDLSNFVEALTRSAKRGIKQHDNLLTKLKTTLEDNSNRKPEGYDGGLSRNLSRLSLSEADRDVDVANDFTKVCCAGCNGVIGSTDSMVRFLVCINPGGYRHKFYTLSGVSTVAKFQYYGEWTTEHSWFDGYRWRIVNCSKCSRHWGWHFRAINSQESFFGIRQDAICLLH